jgi:hypothetical protein
MKILGYIPLEQLRFHKKFFDNHPGDCSDYVLVKMMPDIPKDTKEWDPPQEWIPVYVEDSVILVEAEKKPVNTKRTKKVKGEA